MEKVEKLIARKLVNQTWDVFYDGFTYNAKDDWWDGVRDGAVTEMYDCEGHIDLPFGPMSSVTGLYTYDEANTEFTFAASNYYADVSGPFGRVSLKLGGVWPTTILRPTNGVKIRGVFGYGADETAVPNDLKVAVLTLFARMYEHRGDELPEIPAQVMTLLAQYERLRV